MRKDDLGADVNRSNKVPSTCPDLLEVVSTAHAVVLEFGELARGLFVKSSGRSDEEPSDTGKGEEDRRREVRGVVSESSNGGR